MTTLAANFVKVRRRRRGACRGLSLIELLISLAIGAVLLTAVAVAFVAASGAVRTNDEFYRAQQAARICINQIMAQTRRCQSGIVSPTSLQLQLAGGERRTYAFNSASNQLTMTINSIAPVQSHPMAHNVTSAAFATDGQSISLTVTVRVGDNSVLLNGSAVPRRNVVYH